MANYAVKAQTGKAVYLIVRNASFQPFNGSIFANWVDGNYSTYALAMAEQGTSGLYTITFPSVAAGNYIVEAHYQAGGTPVIDATVDTVIGSDVVFYDGVSSPYGVGSVTLSSAEHNQLFSIDPNFAVVSSPVDQTGTLTLVEGDDYSLNPITFTLTNSPDFTSAAVSLGFIDQSDYDSGNASPLLSISGTINVVSSVVTFSFTPTADNIELLITTPPNDPLDLVYQIRATIGGKNITTHLGSATVNRKVLV